MHGLNSSLVSDILTNQDTNIVKELKSEGL